MSPSLFPIPTPFLFLPVALVSLFLPQVSLFANIAFVFFST